MDEKRSKIKALITPAQARILKALLENPGLWVVWNGRGARWQGTNWPVTKRELGDPRQVSVRTLVNSGLLKNQEGSEIHWRPSDAGVIAFDQFGAIPDLEIRASVADLMKALAHDYGKSHILVTEVPVDLERKRFIDVLAVPIYKGASPISFELKVSREDFLAELNQPLKRQAGMAIAAYFYFVAPPGIVDLDELPAECGLKVWNGRHIETVVEAQWLGASQPTWDLIAAIAKRIIPGR